MKKMTFKNVSTEIRFDEYNGELAVQRLFGEYNRELAVQRLIVLNGKATKNEIKKAIENYNYINGSVEVNVKKEVYKIPYNVIEELVKAGFCHPFDVDENESFSFLNFPKTLKFKFYTTPLMTQNVVLIDDDTATDCSRIDSISIPTKVLDFLHEQYAVVDKEEGGE